VSDRGEILDISTDDLRSSAPTFARESDRLREAAAALKSTLDGLASPWGDDKQGKEFEAAYGPNVAKIEHAVGILVQGLASVHTAMADMADNHVDNEDLVKSMFDRGTVEAEGRE
jgi:uncharacterized protein YukE